MIACRITPDRAGQRADAKQAGMSKYCSGKASFARYGRIEAFKPQTAVRDSSGTVARSIH